MPGALVPVVTFSKQVKFPIAAVRTMLSQHLPIYKWQCGEDDTGAEQQMGAFHPLILVTGRASSALIFTELRAVPGRLDGPAPPHQWHLTIGEPTIENDKVSERIKLAICAAVMLEDEEGAMCQLRPGGNWLRVEELHEVFQPVFGGASLAVADGLGTPASRFSGPGAAPGAPPPQVPPPSPPVSPEPPPGFGRRAGGFGRKGL